MAMLPAFMTVLTFVQVVMRYVVNTGWVWSLEATTYSFVAGVICNAGMLGILIPPSLVMVVYGAITESSTGRLFIASIYAGIFTPTEAAAVSAVYAFFIASAFMFAFLLTTEQIPQMTSEFIVGMGLPVWGGFCWFSTCCF